MESRAVIGRRRACLHVPRVRGTTFKPGGGAGARLEEAEALQLRGVGAAASEAKAASVALTEAPAPRPGKCSAGTPQEALWRWRRVEAAARGRRCC